MTKKKEDELEPGGAQAPEGSDDGGDLVEPGLLGHAGEVDPDLPETDAEDLGGEDEDDQHDPLDVVLPLNHAKELVDNLRRYGYSSLADAFLAVEAGETITIHVEV